MSVTPHRISGTAVSSTGPLGRSFKDMPERRVAVCSACGGVLRWLASDTVRATDLSRAGSELDGHAVAFHAVCFPASSTRYRRLP